MDINVSTPGIAEAAAAPERVYPEKSETVENVVSIPKTVDDDSNSQTLPTTSFACQFDSHAAAVEKLGGVDQTKNDTVSPSSLTATNEMEQNFTNNEKNVAMMSSEMEFAFSFSDKSTAAKEEMMEEDEDDDDDEMEEGEGAEYDITTGSTIRGNDNGGGEMSAASMLQNMNHHSFDDIQFFPSNNHRSLRLQPQFQFHQDQFNDPNFHMGPNLSCFDASGLVNLSGSGSVSNSFSLISDSTSGDINSAFSESPFVFPDNVMEYGEPQFFPGNCVGYLETILEEDDEEYEEEEGCSGRHWWTADSDTDTDSVIRVDNNGQTQQQQQKSTSCQQASTTVGHAHGSSSNNNSVASIPGEKDEVRPHFRSSASSKPFELEDLHLFDQLDHAFEETLREPKRRPVLAAFGHQSQSVGQAVESDNAFAGNNQTTAAASLNSSGNAGVSAAAAALSGSGGGEGVAAHCQKTTTSCSTAAGASNNNDSKTGTGHHHVFIESTNNESKDEMTTKGLKMLTQENVKAHSEENSAKIIYEVDEEKEQSNKKLGNAESRETFGSSLSPSSSDSEAPAEVAEEDFFYSSPGSEEEECRSQEETESEESCSSSDDSEKKGVVLAEFSLGPHAGNNGVGNGGAFNPSSGGIFGSGTRSRRSFDSPSRLKSFRSFDSLNCLAGTELLFSKPDTFPSIHHIKEVSEPSSESESSNEVSAADDRGLVIPEEDEEEEDVEQNNKIEGSQSLPSQHLNTTVDAAVVGFPGPSLNQISNKNSVATSSTSTVSSSASGSGLRSTENLSEDSGIGNDGISSTAASTPGAFIEESNVIMSSNGKQNEDCNKATSPAAPVSASSISCSSTLLASPIAANAQEVDSGLLPDSAKDYISRAEFALNPFVYSSLSSSEPESSISSAPSLSCNKMSIGKDESLQVQQQLHATGKMKDMPNDDNVPDQAITTTKTANAIKDAPHTFVSDCHSNIATATDKAQVQNHNVSCNKGSDMENGTDERMNSTNECSTTENSQNNPDYIKNKNHDTIPLESIVDSNGLHPEIKQTPPPPTSSPVPTIINHQSTALLSQTSKSNNNNNDNYSHQQMIRDGGRDKREFAIQGNPSYEGQAIIINGSNSTPVTTTHLASSSSSSLLPATSKTATDANQACARSPSAIDKLANTSLSTLSAQLPVTGSQAKSNGISNISNNSSVSVAATEIVSKMGVKPTDPDTTVGMPIIFHEQDDHQKYNMTSVVMTDRDVDKENAFSDDGDIISSSSTETTENFCMASSRQPHPQTTTVIMNEHERHDKEEVSSSSISSSSLSSKTCSYSPTNLQQGDDDDDEKEEKQNEMNSLTTTQNTCSSPSAKGLLAGVLNMSKVDDAEGEEDDEARKHAPLQVVSSSPLSSAADKSFSTCRLLIEHDHHHHHHHQSQKHSSSSSYSSSSSSSSGDEQNENIPCSPSQQPRFRRQRSDSESEYEAAESAVERNNVDMAYDIIVNSPSKKQATAATVASPISSVSDVVGATANLMMTTTTTTTTTAAAAANIVERTTSPSFSAISSPLAHAPVVEETRSSSVLLNSSSSGVRPANYNTSASATPAQYHSQSQNETNANKCDNKESGPVSTLNGSLISIHRNDNNMHNISKSNNTTAETTTSPVYKTENINKSHNTNTTAAAAADTTTMRNYEDKKLPVFESCLDDYDDDDDYIATNNVSSTISTRPHAAPPAMPIITENMQSNSASNNNGHTTNNIFIAVSSYTQKSVCTNSHEAGQMRNVTHAAAAAVVVNGTLQKQLSTAITPAKEQESSSSPPSSSFPLEKQQPHRHEIENTSLLLHHHQLQHNEHQRQYNNQREQYENSDELTTTSSQVALPQSHFHVSAAPASCSSGNGIIGGGFGAHRNHNNSEYKDLIVTHGGAGSCCEPVSGGNANGKNKNNKKNNNFSTHAEAQHEQQKQDHHHQQQEQRNVLGSVTLDDSTSADVAHNNLQLNHQQEPHEFSTSHPAGVALKSNIAPRPKENYSKVSSSSSAAETSLDQHKIATENSYQTTNNHHSHTGSSGNNHSQSSTTDPAIITATSNKLTQQQQQNQRQRSVECSSSTSNNNAKGYHHHQHQHHSTGDVSNNKVVIAEPYYPNQIGVAEVKKFLAGYVAPKECVSFSGPVEPPSSASQCAAQKDFCSSTLENNNKQRKTEPAEYYHSQSVKNLEKSATIGGPTITNTATPSSSSSSSQVNTTGRERVILGDSNFGFFGCSSHSRSSSSSNTTTSSGANSNSNNNNITRGAVVVAAETPDSAVSPTTIITSNAPTCNVLPQVNLDLHSISIAATNESGYGFPSCSTFPISTVEHKNTHSQQQQQQNGTWPDKEHHQLLLPLKENNTFCPSSIDTSNSGSNNTTFSSAQKSGSGSSSTSIKRSVSPSSSFAFSSSFSNKAAQELSKDLGKGAVAALPPPPPQRRDQPQQQHQSNAKDIRQQQQQQQHLHLEDISLYAGIDKFSVPLGAIKAAVVAVVPTIPSYIVGCSSSNTTTSHNSTRNAPSSTVEKNASKIQNSNDSLVQAVASNTTTTTAGVPHQSVSAEANGNLSKVFPKGTITTCTKKSNNSSLLNIGSSSVSSRSSSATDSAGSNILPKGGENNDTHGATVPDILILKQFPSSSSSCMPANNNTNAQKSVVLAEHEQIEAVEQIKRGAASVKGVMEFDIATAPCSNRNGGMSANGRNNIKNKKLQDSNTGGNNSTNNPSTNSSNTESISSVEMLRSDSPAGSSAAPSGISHKTKTYGPRNEVEVVVVSSRTPSPAPGGFVSTSSSFSSSSSSSQKLPSASFPESTSAGQQQRNNEPVFSRSSIIGGGGGGGSSRRYDDDGVATTDNYSSSSGGGGGILREGSIPPPPKSPTPASNTKATRSRVHFSPVVAEISWRESYIDQSSECSGSTEDFLAKLEDDSDEDPNKSHNRSGKSALVENNGSNNHIASANLRKAGAVAAATMVGGGGVGHSGDMHDNCGGGIGNSDVGSSVVRPLQVYDIQMSTRADSPSGVKPSSTRGNLSSGKCPILVEKVEMRSSPLHDHEEEEQQHRHHIDRLLALGESQCSRKLMLLDDDDEDEDEDNVDNDPERVTDLVDFRHNSNTTSHGGNNNGGDQNNGTLGLYEDVEVQIEPTTKKTPGSTTLSMVPDLLSQCENTNNTLTHIDVKIEETVPGLNTKNIVLNIGPTPALSNTNKDMQQQQPQKIMRKSQSPQPQDVMSSSETPPRQIFPKMFAEDNKNDNKRNSSSSLSSSSKGKKSSKGFTIQGLGSSGKKSDKDVAKDMGGLNGNNGSNNGSNMVASSVVATTQNVEQQSGGGVADTAKENKKSSKPGFFERLSKIRLSSGSKNKKQKVHPKTEEIHQEGDSSGTPTVNSTIGGATSRPLRSANSVNVNGSGNSSSKHGSNNNSGANNNSSCSQIASASSSSSVQPILKKSAASASTIPSGIGPHYNNGNNEMGMVGDSENEPDEATQAFENILEEIAGLKSIQLRQEKSSSSSIDKSPSSAQVRSFAKRKQFYNTNNAGAGSPSPPVSPHDSNNRSYTDLDSKLSQFKEDASRTLDTISKSHPDLEIIEDAVRQRQKSLSPEPTMHDLESTKRPAASTLPKTSSSASSKSPYAATEAAQNSEREWYRLLKSATEKFSYHKGPKDEHSFNGDGMNAMLPHKTGIVETDLDTGASREMLDEDMLQLDCKVPCYTVSTSEIPTTAAAASTSASIVTSAGSPGTAAKTRSLTNLSTRLPLSIAPSSQFEESTGDLSDSEERAKSLEFLLDENHKSSSVPPENKLRLETRQLSEHELRIQRSLQRLNVPEWYKQHGTLSTATNAPPPAATSTQNKSGTLSILKRSEYGSSGGLAGGWSGLSSYKAPSMSSLQSNGGRNSGTLNKNFVRGRPATMSVTTRTSKESLLASGSASHSPSAFERSSFTYGMPFTMTRFGQGRLSTHSSSVSPPSTPDSTTKTSSYVKKPYLGWRSQEKLNAGAASSATPNTGPPKLSIYLPPAERLAADLLATRAKSPHPPVRPPVSDRPPLPKAPPRSEKTALTKTQHAIDDSIEAPGARSSSPVISKQTSSLAVVTKLPQSQQSNSIPPPDSSQGNSNEGLQSHSRSKVQSARVTPDVHDSIRQVTTAISHYVNRGNETQSQPKTTKPKTGKKQAIWIESSFVGQKPPSN